MNLLYTLEFPSFAACLDELAQEEGGSACYLLISEGWQACGAYLTNPHHLNKNFSFHTTQIHAIRLIYPEWDHEIWIDLLLDRQGDYFEYQKYKRSVIAGA
ncbi:hypothetical protein [Pseudomonas sp. NPDC089401]|uniref:hypothetical protein n=1 Tax=Pseudomonas sp. NPDC089401 TaxID=3364462 RepID=UPI0037FEB194